MAHYSVLITGGVVIDGRGNPRERADIGIEGDKIEAVGDLSGGWGDVVINAANFYVVPGFIDITNHSDTHWTLFNNPLQESLLTQGITTILGGSCGVSLVPLAKGGAIEGIQKWVDVSQININWQTMGEFFSEIRKKNFGVNFATLVGHGTIRRGVLGDDSRPASYEEIKKMRFLLEEALKEGAFGFSTNLGASHGKPASDEEVAEFFKTAKEYNVLAKNHLADEGKNILPSLSRLLSFSRNTGAMTHISHFKALGRTAWGNFERALFMIEEAKHEGLQITCDLFPYTKTGSNLYMLLPGWALEGGKKKIMERLEDKKEKEKLIASLKELTLHYDRIIIASGDRSVTVIGKSIKEISLEAGLSPEEIFLDLLKVNELRVSIFNEAILESNIDALLKKDYAAVASDGVGYTIEKTRELPHPRSFGAFPRMLARFVREKEIIGWEEAIYKMSGFPAKIIGISDRGRIEVGAFADIAIINPETVQDLSDYRNPFQLSRGVEWLLVNGRVAVENGTVTGVMNGRALKKG